MTQVALSVVLLVGAGLFVRSLSNLRAVPLGLDADRLILARVQFASGNGILPPSSSLHANTAPTNDRDEFWGEAVRRVLMLPGVANAALTIGIPMRSSQAISFSIRGRDSLPRLTSGGPYANAVSPTYFATLGTRLLRGRAFTDADGAKSPRVAIVNATFARLAWPGESPLGACVKVGGDSLPCSTIVGVVEDIHRQGVIEPAQMQYYVPLAQWPVDFGGPALLVRSRSAGGVERTVSDVRHALQAVSPKISYPLVQSFGDFLDPQLASWLLGARMFSLFGGLAFTIALIGLYGLLAHNVAERRHEMGIRAALGAAAEDIVALVVFQGARIVIAGLGLGLAAAALLAGRIGPLLFGVEPRDLGTYVSIALLAGSLAVLASILPARRAAAVDPMEALRADG